MTKHNAKGTAPVLPSAVSATLVALSVLMSAGCDSPSGSDGVAITEVDLVPTLDNPFDPLLVNLHCPDVGIFTETCILEDPDNPFRSAIIPEFDENNPDAENKFNLAADIPAGQTGARSRYYLWGTALARLPSGENQYFTALALHELYTASGDLALREQALRAYRSVWDNFFGSVVFFTCCGEFFPFPRDDTAFPVPLNELVLERLVRAFEFPGVDTPERDDYPNGFTPLVPEDPTPLQGDAGLIELETQEVIGDWGYNYQCTGAGTFDDPRLCFVSVNGG